MRSKTSLLLVYTFILMIMLNAFYGACNPENVSTTDETLKDVSKSVKSPSGWSDDIRLTYTIDPLDWDQENDTSNARIAVWGNTIHMVYERLCINYTEIQPGIWAWAVTLSDIYYIRSEDGGKTWTEPMKFTYDEFDPDSPTCYNGSFSPKIVVSGNNVHVIYERLMYGGNDEIIYRNSTDGGVTWNEEKMLTPDDGYMSRGSYTALNGSTIHVVWIDNISGLDWKEIFYMRSLDGGVTWDDGQGNIDLPRQITFPLPNADWGLIVSGIAVSGSNIHVTGAQSLSFKEGGEQWSEWCSMYLNSTDNGETWSNTTIISRVDKEGSFYPRVAAYDSNIHLVWEDWGYPDDGGEAEVVYRNSVDNGVTWNSWIRLTNDMVRSEQPTIAVKENKVHVVWVDSRDHYPYEDAFEIYYINSPDGGRTWGDETRLTYAKNSSVMPEIISVNGYTHLVFIDNRTGDNHDMEVYYKRSPDFTNITYINEDWNVNTTEVRANETIVLTGNLTIENNGNLTFRNVTLKMNCSFNGEYHIEVQTGGEFYIYDNDNDNTTTEDASNITSNTAHRYLFWVRENAKMVMRNSCMYYCGYEPSPWEHCGLYIKSTDMVIIDHCLISNNYNGVFLKNSNITISNTTIEFAHEGIWCRYSSPVISNNILISNSQHGIVCDEHSNAKIDNNIVINNQINIQIQTYSEPFIINTNASSSNEDGIFCAGTQTMIINCVVINNPILGIGGTGGAYATIVNSTIANNGWGIGGRGDLSLSSSWFTTINTSFNKTNVYFDAYSNLTVKWYLNTKIVDLANDPVSSAKVIIKNTAAEEVYNGTTDSDGYVRWLPCTEHVQNQTTTVYHTPHNITVTKDGYTTGYANVTMNESKEITITLLKEHDNIPPVIISHSPIGENVPLTSHIFVKFNETMNQTSAENAFIISPNVDGEFGWDNNTLIFMPTNLLSYNTTYNVTITTNAKDLAGNYLGNNYSWGFTTEKEKVNHEPVIKCYHPLFNPVINETESLTFNITATDVDTGDTLTTQWYLNDTLVATGESYTFVSDYESAGVYEIKVIVTDDGFPPLSVNHSWNLTVLNKNRKPVLESIDDQTAYEGQLFTLQVNASDPDNDIIMFSDNTTLFDINQTTGLISFTPNYDSNGAYHINITVSDGMDVDYKVFTLTIVDVNRKPTATISLPLDNAKFTTKDNIFFDATGSSDLDNDDLTYSWESSIDGSIGNTASFSKKLSKGTHTITLTVDDGNGGTDTAQITVTVNKPSEPSGGFIPFANIAALIIGLMFLTLLLNHKRKKKFRKREG